MKDKFQISLIIAVYKQINFLDIVLQSVNAQSFKDFEVVIAEDDNSEKVKAFIETQKSRYPFQIKHVSQNDAGFRKNKILNEAVRKSSGEYLVFIDGDCLLHKHYLREYFKRRSDSLCLFGRRVRLSRKITNELISKNVFKELSFLTLLFSKSKRVEDALYLPFSISRRKTGILGCSFCVSKKNLITINGFDEDFVHPLYGEDTDVARRLLLIGVKLKCTKFNTIQYHLFHDKEDRKNIKITNKKLYKEKQLERLSFCQNGLERK